MTVRSARPIPSVQKNVPGAAPSQFSAEDGAPDAYVEPVTGATLDGAVPARLVIDRRVHPVAGQWRAAY
jgi:hypothetical protein